VRADLVEDFFRQIAALAKDDPSTPQNEARFNYNNYAALTPIESTSALFPNRTKEDRTATYLEGMVRFGKLDLVGGARYERVKRDTVAVLSPSIQLDQPGFVYEPRTTFVEAGLVDFVPLSGTQNTLTPSLLATYRASDSLVVRLGYFRSTVHPDFRMLTRSPQVFLDMRQPAPRGTIREANPGLKPTKTDNYDLDIAYYFKENPGLVRAAFFLKEVSNNFTSVLLADQSNDSVKERILEMLSPLQKTRPDLLELPDNMEFFLNRPENGEGGRIYGIELEVIRQLDFLPGFWKNFSVLGNVTFTDGDVPTDISARNDAGEAIVISYDRALKDQSRWSGTASIAYEQGGFSGRLIYSYQSESVTDFDEHNLNVIVPEYDTLDLRLSYSFDGGLGRYTVFLEGDDLLNGAKDADIRRAIAPTFGQGSPDFFFPTTLQFNGGRTLTLGVRATF